MAAVHDHGGAPVRNFAFGFDVNVHVPQPNLLLQQTMVKVQGLLHALPDGTFVVWPPV